MTWRRRLIALLLAAPLLAQAQGSLAERRQAIAKGTAPGKVLIEAPRRAEPAASAADAASAGSAGAPSGAPPRANGGVGGGAAAAPAARPGLLGRLPPPSGRSLADSRRLDAPDQGIVIKPATPASAPR